MKRLLLLLPLVALAVSCSSNKNSNKNNNNSGNYFKQYYDQVVDSETEYSFMHFYDVSENRFNIEFLYEPHFHFGLKIEQYAVIPFYIYPDEGEFSEDYESVTFTLVDSDSELFPAVKYVLSHKILNGSDSFSLKANRITYGLTTTPKQSPIAYDPGVLGQFAYIVEDDTKFTLKVTSEEHFGSYYMHMYFTEGNLYIEALSLTIRGKLIIFTLGGHSDGEYLKAEAEGTFEYINENVEEESWILTIGEAQYQMTYIEEEHEQVSTGYFYNNLVTISNSRFSMKIMSLAFGGSAVQVAINELGEGGRQNISTFFDIGDDGESLTNRQNIVGNTVFTTGNSYVFRHYINGGQDRIDLFRNDDLFFTNLTITPNE